MTKPVQLTASIRIKSRTSTATLIVPVFAYTDYPLWFLGDEPGQPAPLRRIEVVGYDGDKYVRVKLGNDEDTIKRGYLYKNDNTALREVSMEAVEFECIDGVTTEKRSTYTTVTDREIVDEELLMGLPGEW